ncbi:transcriptional regulator [Cuniculiplasma sp. SKW3]|uniref:transcriptional regulator n=1 Tax=Cuniculiplasma sp. SKW3 TaxID=3400170 RepID=UPI003FD21504
MNERIEKEDREIILERLSSQLGEPVLRSSQRLLILIMLKVNGRMRFYELQTTLGIGKGSLSNHLDKLADKDLIKIKDILTLTGPGKSIELTDKGKEIVEEYSRLMSLIFEDKKTK